MLPRFDWCVFLRIQLSYANPTTEILTNKNISKPFIVQHSAKSRPLTVTLPEKDFPKMGKMTCSVNAVLTVVCTVIEIKNELCDLNLMSENTSC